MHRKAQYTQDFRPSPPFYSTHSLRGAPNNRLMLLATSGWISFSTPIRRQSRNTPLTDIQGFYCCEAGTLPQGPYRSIRDAMAQAKQMDFKQGLTPWERALWCRTYMHMVYVIYHTHLCPNTNGMHCDGWSSPSHYPPHITSGRCRPTGYGTLTVSGR